MLSGNFLRFVMNIIVIKLEEANSLTLIPLNCEFALEICPVLFRNEKRIICLLTTQVGI